MKTIVKLAAVASLSGLSLSAAAWWGGGPYGYPYWGGYAPVVAAPVATVSPGQLNTVYHPRGYDPFLSGPGDFLSDPFMPPMYREMFKRSEAERELSLKASQARREAFRARATAQRAAMDARRQAWRESARSYNYSPFGYSAPYGRPGADTAPASEAAPKASSAEQPVAAAEAPAAVPAQAAVPAPAAVPEPAPTAPAPQPMAATPAAAAQ